jgi:hypothetical protein
MISALRWLDELEEEDDFEQEEELEWDFDEEELEWDFDEEELEWEPVLPHDESDFDEWDFDEELEEELDDDVSLSDFSEVPCASKQTHAYSAVLLSSGKSLVTDDVKSLRSLQSSLPFSMSTIESSARVRIFDT